MVQVARKPQVPTMVLIVNKVPSVFDPDVVKAQVEQTPDQRRHLCPALPGSPGDGAVPASSDPADGTCANRRRQMACWLTVPAAADPCRAVLVDAGFRSLRLRVLYI
jgi:hypothetical protein